MKNHTIDVPGTQELARPRSRRDFFKSLAVAGAGATAASMLLSKEASAKTDDVDIANFALTLEYLEAEFYAMAVDSGVLSGDALGVVENLADHEAQHVDALNWLLGVVPYANEAFPKALTLDEVSAAVAPFMGGKMMSTGGPKLSPEEQYRLNQAYRLRQL